jgi:hypothetical protein
MGVGGGIQAGSIWLIAARKLGEFISRWRATWRSNVTWASGSAKDVARPYSHLRSLLSPTTSSNDSSTA